MAQGQPPLSTTRRPARTGGPGAQGALKVEGTAALLTVSGLIDESFGGFGVIPETVKTLVIDVNRMNRMTSFGVRQWLKAMDSMPRRLTDVYVLGCPTFFVDQMNMVLNFGGAARVITVQAPRLDNSSRVGSGARLPPPLSCGSSADQA